MTVAITLGLEACDTTDSVDRVFTGKEQSYRLVSASDYNIQGMATFQEKADGELQLTLQLENTVSGGLHPAHMHYGTVDVPDSEMALMLTPVEGATGTSVTTFSSLLDGSPFTFADLLDFDGSVKVHLDDGANSKVVLCGANIGRNETTDASTITVCSTDLP